MVVPPNEFGAYVHAAEFIRQLATFHTSAFLTQDIRRPAQTGRRDDPSLRFTRFSQNDKGGTERRGCQKSERVRANTSWLKRRARPLGRALR